MRRTLSLALFAGLMCPTALADTVEVSLEALGTKTEWTVHDVQAGAVLSKTIEVDRRRRLELSVDYVPLDGDKVRFDAELSEVRSGWLGREHRKMMSAPSITTTVGTIATMAQATRVPIEGTDPVEFRETDVLRLELLPTRDG